MADDLVLRAAATENNDDKEALGKRRSRTRSLLLSLSATQTDKISEEGSEDEKNMKNQSTADSSKMGNYSSPHNKMAAVNVVSDQALTLRQSNLPMGASASQTDLSLQTPPHAPDINFLLSFYYFATTHKGIAFRHIIMIIVVFAYTFLGGVIFFLIEGNNEELELLETKARMEKTISLVADDLRTISLTSNESLDIYIKNAYIMLLKMDGKWSYSTFAKEENEANRMWTFNSAMFFSATVYTAIGFGSIYPSTTISKAIIIVYGLMFLPLTTVVLRDLGQYVLVALTKIYARLLIRFRRVRGCEVDGTEQLTLPIEFCSLMSLGYLVAAAVFVHNYDALYGPPGTEIDMFNSFYFSYIAISTIGLGDVMPNNAPFSPVVMAVFFFGLPIMRVVNRVTYVALENGVFGLFALMEQKISGELPPPQEILERRVSAMPGDRRLSVITGTPTARYLARHSLASVDGEERANQETFNNNLTVRSIATFMRARSDVYGGDFGRVVLTKNDVE